MTWQIAINKGLPIVVDVINYGLQLAEGVIEGLAWGFNQKLAAITPNSFVTTIGENLALNLTTPRAPDLNKTSDLISVWLDGRFVDPSTMQSSEPINTLAPVRLEDHK